MKKNSRKNIFQPQDDGNLDPELDSVMSSPDLMMKKSK
jgi:hypothetical protein